MSDDAAQDKKTEDDSIAEADAQGSAEAASTPELSKDTAAETPAAKAVAPEALVPEDAAVPAAVETPQAAAASVPPVPTFGEPKPKSGLLAAVAVPLVALIAVGVVLVAAIAAAGAFWWQSHNKTDDQADHDAAAKAACEFVKQVSAYDDKNLDSYVPRVQALITGKFKDTFDPVSNDLKAVLAQAHAKSTLNVVRCAWESGDKDKATVLVGLSQTSSNDMRPQPLVLTAPTAAELEKKDGKWLVSDFQLITAGDDNPLIPGAGGGAPQSGQSSAPAQPSGQPAPSGAPAPAAPTAPKPAN
ncbi:hypothetical protein [Nocardia sp. NBC_00511]|uniref:hypothetical protein n=1 Tax=Nocardia sp. NBC_00511 TaxID=2903591 RepID=UPI0030DF2A96